MPTRGTEIIISGFNVRFHFVEHLERLGHDLGPDPITGDHSKPHPHTSVNRTLGYEYPSSVPKQATAGYRQSKNYRSAATRTTESPHTFVILLRPNRPGHSPPWNAPFGLSTERCESNGAIRKVKQESSGRANL